MVQYQTQRQRLPHGLQATFEAAKQAESNFTVKLVADAMAFSIYIRCEEKRSMDKRVFWPRLPSLKSGSLPNLEALPADLRKAVAKRVAAAMETTAQQPAETGDCSRERRRALGVLCSEMHWEADGNSLEKRHRNPRRGLHSIFLGFASETSTFNVTYL